MSEQLAETESKVIAVVACDFERAAIGTRSRLLAMIGGKPVLSHLLERLLAVAGLSEIVLATPPAQMDVARAFCIDPRIHLIELAPRAENLSKRIAIARAWNLHAWRGGAGQWTAFDEEYHPATVAAACERFHAHHVLSVHSHSLFLDVEITSALIHHHLHKNHEMRLTYTPSAPGLSGIVLQAAIAKEMGEATGSVLPGQLLGYDPAAPTFDTLIRDACMQVDPALSKVPNRFCVDTERSFLLAQELMTHGVYESAAALALAAARAVAPGVSSGVKAGTFPRELEIELTGKRLTTPPGSVPAVVRLGRGELDAEHWERWFAEQRFADDLLVTFAGDGDAGMYGDLRRVLKAAAGAGPLSVCVQSDFAGEMDELLASVQTSLVDVISVPFYGHTRETYAKVAAGDNSGRSADLFEKVMANMQRLAGLTSAQGGVPLVVPRLLKVRETIPEMETFFDVWIQRCGWATIEGPTDRAGAIPFAGVVDMAPPKRRACRRLWDRLLIRSNGVTVACDQDMRDRLQLGNIESQSLAEMWSAMENMRDLHSDAGWGDLTPCATCREWHRA